MGPPAGAAPGAACGELLAPPADVKAYGRKEMALIREAFVQDEGGEG